MGSINYQEQSGFDVSVLCMHDCVYSYVQCHVQMYIVHDETAITSALGLCDSRMVISYSSPRKPHHVTMFSSGKVTCDCLNYTTKSLVHMSLPLHRRMEF